VIKETKIRKEVIIQQKYCDVCGVKIGHRLACTNATCAYCKKDLCEECIGYEEETPGDYRRVWCNACWQIGDKYRPMIKALRTEVSMLYERWQKESKYEEEKI